MSDTLLTVQATTAVPNTFVVVVNSTMVVDLVVTPTKVVTFWEKPQEKSSSSATIPKWRRIAKLARVAIDEGEIIQLCAELDSIMSFVDQLALLDVGDVEPMTSVAPMAMKMRKDEITDGGIADDILANAPAREDHFFVVPKVVE